MKQIMIEISDELYEKIVSKKEKVKTKIENGTAKNKQAVYNAIIDGKVLNEDMLKAIKVEEDRQFVLGYSLGV